MSRTLLGVWGVLLPPFAVGLAFSAYGQQLKTRTSHPGAPEKNWINVNAVNQEVEGPWRHLRGSARVETSDSLLTADEIDYNSETAKALARGHVHFEHY